MLGTALKMIRNIRLAPHRLRGASPWGSLPIAVFDWPLVPVVLVLAPLARRPGRCGTSYVTGVLAELARTFATLSLVSIGGVNVLLPEIRRQVVDVHGWMTDAVFANTFAIANAAPGSQRPPR